MLSHKYFGVSVNPTQGMGEGVVGLVFSVNGFFKGGIITSKLGLRILIDTKIKTTMIYIP